MQGRSINADLREWTGGHSGEEDGGMNWERSPDIHTLPRVRQTASGKRLCKQSKLSWVPLDDLEEWDGVFGWGSKREMQEGGIYILRADLLWCMEETNTSL